MPRIPGVSQRDAVRVFEKLGYRIVRQSGPLVMSNGKTRLALCNIASLMMGMPPSESCH